MYARLLWFPNKNPNWLTRDHKYERNKPLRASFVDPHHIDADPDDPSPWCGSDPDPDPKFRHLKIDADPDPLPDPAHLDADPGSQNYADPLRI